MTRPASRPRPSAATRTCSSARWNQSIRSWSLPEVINVAVSGAAGRMGQTVCDAVEGAEDMALVGRADPQLGVALQDVLGDADVVVDFSQPDTALHNAHLCLEAGVHCVMGTTGADFSQLEGGGSANLFVAP